MSNTGTSCLADSKCDSGHCINGICKEKHIVCTQFSSQYCADTLIKYEVPQNMTSAAIPRKAAALFFLFFFFLNE